MQKEIFHGGSSTFIKSFDKIFMFPTDAATQFV